jgi:hypothetical protein
LAFCEKIDYRGLVLAAFLFVLTVPGAAFAYTLDWDSVGWPGGAGTLTNTYTDVDSSGWDVQVQFTDPDSNLVQVPDGDPASPTTDSSLATPGVTGDNLFIRADTNGGGAGITIRFDFTHSTATEVTDIVLSLIDVDTADAFDTQWIDDISITGYDFGGGTVLPDSVVSPTGTPTWTYNALTGVLLGDVNEGNAGATNDDGTATITFNAAVAAIELTYLNGYTPGGNQWIGMSDIAFVPEPNTFSLLWMGLIGLSIRRRRA